MGKLTAEDLRDLYESLDLGGELLHYPDSSNNDVLWDRRNPAVPVFLCHGFDGVESTRAAALRDILRELPTLLADATALREVLNGLLECTLVHDVVPEDLLTRATALAAGQKEGK